MIPDVEAPKADPLEGTGDKWVDRYFTWLYDHAKDVLKAAPARSEERDRAARLVTSVVRLEKHFNDMRKELANRTPPET